MPDRIQKEEDFARALLERVAKYGKSKRGLVNDVRRLLGKYLCISLKRCCSCWSWLDVSKFPKDSSRPDGKRPRCLQCDKEYRLAAYWASPEKFRAKKRKHDRKIGRVKEGYMPNMKVHFKHPGTPIPQGLEGHDLRSWKLIAKNRTLCWRFGTEEVKTSAVQAEVTCRPCLNMMRKRQVRGEN